MRRKEVIEALCNLVTKVGSKFFEDQHTHNCFCEVLQKFDPMVEDSIVEFIKQAVEEKIQRQKDHGDSSFPIHYEGKDLKVFTNSSGEVFVQNTLSHEHLRINADRNAIVFTTNREQVRPVIIGNMIGWQVGNRL